MNVRALYLPILLKENHWLGSAILNESRTIVLYDPQGKGKDCEDCTNNEILKVLLRLIGDEYRISGEYSKDEVNAFLSQWSLLDLSSNVSNENGYPR